MDACLRNDTRISNYTFDLFAPAYSLNLPCGNSTYFRADVGGSLIPYIYTVTLIALHLPVLWERIHHWDKVQELSLALALFSLVVTVAGYWTSGLEPGQILTWTPLTMMLDAGAMLQLIVLIVAKEEGDKKWKGVRDAAVAVIPKWMKRKPKTTDIPDDTTAVKMDGLISSNAPATQPIPIQHLDGDIGDARATSDDQIETIPLQSSTAGSGGTADIAQPNGAPAARTERISRQDPHESNESDTDNTGRVVRHDTESDISGHSTPSFPPTPSREPEDIKVRGKRAWIVIAALFIIVAILMLQIIGWAKSIEGLQVRDLKVPYCSPILQTFMVAVSDGNTRNKTTNCPTYYDITIDSNKGIGCVNLPARRQMHWLLGTAIILPLTLVSEAIDIGFLLHEPSRASREGGIDLRRPWTTMLVGILILVVFAINSYQHSMNLPDGISRSVWVYRHDPTSNSFGACIGNFHAAGLRGSILAWTDGVMGFLDQFYIGPE